MSKQVTIPTIANPFTVEINGVKYSYLAGSTVSVPDDVAAVIENINRLLPKEAVKPGEAGQVWTRTEAGEGWADLPELPAASEEDPGMVFQMANIEDSAATTVAQIKTDFNALLAALVEAGIMAEGEGTPIPPIGGGDGGGGVTVDA